MGKRKKEKLKSDEIVDTVLGIAWYNRDQWDRLRQIASDPENIEDTYDEWKATAEKAMRDYEKNGVQTHKVQINVEELVAWCKAQHLPIDGAARSAFAGEKLYEQIEEKE